MLIVWCGTKIVIFAINSGFWALFHKLGGQKIKIFSQTQVIGGKI